ncbi:MAG: hypothetical protein QHJ73_00710 [Armatimonadota bacterium]|nr:hypothetical protein [Armatimonadota bacterium]
MRASILAATLFTATGVWRPVGPLGAPEVTPMVSHFTVERPNLQTPMSLIIDDPTPIYADRLSPEEVARRQAEGKGVDWWTFFEHLADLFDEYGVKGKFSVIPYRSGIGMADRLESPEHRRQLAEFVQFVQRRLLPGFDITPEILSHGVVLDPDTDKPLGVDDPEEKWSQRQSAETLEKYIARGLVALKNIGLEANGVTSPSDFGARNEANYVRAISGALKRVNQTKLAWYFLQSDGGDYIEPRLMYFDRANAEAVVSIMPTGLLSDIGLSRRFGQDVAPNVDVHITADGREGVIPRMIENNSYLVFYKHWWALYDQGQETGLKVLREVLDRTRRFYGQRVQWLPCSAIARYYAAAKTYRLTAVRRPDGALLRLESVFPCPAFTVTFRVPTIVTEVRVDGARLTRVQPDGSRLDAGTWRQQGDLVSACFDLGEKSELSIRTGDSR